MRCPITYEEIADNGKYSKRGLAQLSPGLKTLRDFPYSADEQRKAAIRRASKMSIQGVQEKLSAVLNTNDEVFQVVDIQGKFILKPQLYHYVQVPQNEDLTMRLAETVGLEVPLHGLIYCADSSLTYFVKRFDRFNKSGKYAVEDFAQLSGNTRDTKYNFSMEKIISILNTHCTFPAIEKEKLFRLTLFNYLVGNEDGHLKNFSLIVRDDIVQLSPCYDLVNTTIILNTEEELALTLKGKKRGLTRNDLVEYYGRERLQISEKMSTKVVDTFIGSMAQWENLVNISFLDDTMKRAYLGVLQARRKNLAI